MTTQDHLQKIKARCHELILLNTQLQARETAIAGWKSTIAAIDYINQVDKENIGQYGERSDYAVELAVEAIRKSIISAWPEELL